MPRDQLEREKKQLLAVLLEGQVQTKLIYLDAERTIPEESFPEFQKKISDHFVEKVLPDRMEQAGAANADEFDEKLRTMGSSLERMKRGFVQKAVAQHWLEGQVEEKPEVSHGEMLDYYHEHRDEYEKPARARWEMLSVRIPRYSDGGAAQAKLARMGNQVLQGRSMAEVLAAEPKDGLECRGGVQGWVTEGGFDVSETFEAGIFSLRVGQPSQIFREGDAYYIIRVIEREEPKVDLFAKDPEVQNEVREKLQKTRRGEQIQKYLARLKKQFPVWTVLDDDVQLAEFRRRVQSARN
jgi:peptidyl-prolyl cis-trans isomerase C